MQYFEHSDWLAGWLPGWVTLYWLGIGWGFSWLADGWLAAWFCYFVLVGDWLGIPLAEREDFQTV